MTTYATTPSINYPTVYEWKQEVKNLSQRLAAFNPTIIISVMKEINPEIEEAISLSKIEIESFEKLPFPREENGENFISEHRMILKKIFNCNSIHQCPQTANCIFH